MRFFPHMISVQLAEISASSDRIAKSPVSVIGHGGPLHGRPFFRFGGGDKTIGMNQPLNFLVGLIQSL